MQRHGRGIVGAHGGLARSLSSVNVGEGLFVNACENSVEGQSARLSRKTRKRDRPIKRFFLLSRLSRLLSRFWDKMAEIQGTPVAQDALSVVQLELGGNPNALALRRPFDPVAHDLDATFRLTRFADLKG
ncbi:hypothetical protein V1478_015521 [Vespula squamosa]|uniref:Uncharacterized protein n=1 Tax=Vespula squamosa TaxID=30214 RepID=A0ABD2A5C4_VESSQ